MIYVYVFFAAKSSGGVKKLSPYNKFMKTELARLKETEPNMAHMDRCVGPLLNICSILTIQIGSSWLQEIGSTPRNEEISLKEHYA